MTSSTTHPTGVSRAALAAALTALLTTGGLSAAHAEPPVAPAGAPRVERVSVAADGTEGNGGSSHGRLSRNGAFTLFSSAATNLTPEPTPRPPGPVHLRDNATGEITRIRESLQDPAVSDDGRYVTYLGWGSHTTNVKLVNLETGQTMIIRHGSSKAGSGQAVMSADGRYIAFRQNSEHPQDPDRVEVYDQETGTYEVVSDGPPVSDRDMVQPAISADGRYVAYRDSKTGDVWLTDRQSGTRTRVDDGGSSQLVQLSDDGRVIAVNAADGAYVRDVRTGETTRFPGKRAAALSPDGRRLLYQDAGPTAYSELRLRHLPSGKETVVHGHARGVPGALADKGRVVFDSDAADVVPGDTNGVPDVFQWSAR
ncbi:TolB family protein [Streptomyces sp. G45]|uniref:TolB family protein n=1 Tax=Streptomyces sp. G45 TaxID=3406627 RepID=UPI003C13BABA